MLACLSSWERFLLHLTPGQIRHAGKAEIAAGSIYTDADCH